MTEFLLFTLYAPLASWGEVAVGETRGSWDRPSRSAVLGLVAAALGLTREEQDEHDALDRAYGVAVRLDAPGTSLIDYHTAQTVAASAAKRSGARTRAELLRSGEPETMLSRRAYRQDAVATAALWLWPDAIQRLGGLGARLRSLSELESALRNPVYTLYAGRRANVFGLPTAPEILETPTLADALLRRSASRGMRTDVPADAHAALQRAWDALRPRRGWGQEVAHDPWEESSLGLRPLRREVRRDGSADRRRWQFANRTVEVGLLPTAAESEDARR